MTDIHARLAKAIEASDAIPHYCGDTCPACEEQADAILAALAADGLTIAATSQSDKQRERAEVAPEPERQHEPPQPTCPACMGMGCTDCMGSGR